MVNICDGIVWLVFSNLMRMFPFLALTHEKGQPPAALGPSLRLSFAEDGETEKKSRSSAKVVLL